MRKTLVDNLKSEIAINLKHFLHAEGVQLYVAANDNIPAGAKGPYVELYAIEEKPLGGNALLSEIKVVLKILGKSWQCNALVDGIYHSLHPHHITLNELTVLLMSLHVESLHSPSAKRIKRKATLRYIVEELLTHPGCRESQSACAASSEMAEFEA